MGAPPPGGAVPLKLVTHSLPFSPTGTAKRWIVALETQTGEIFSRTRYDRLMA